MQLGMRKKVYLPQRYKGFQIIRSHGRVYAVPPLLDPEEYHQHGRPFSHAAILSASTRNELEALIDRDDPSTLQESGALPDQVEPISTRSPDDSVTVEFAGWLPVYEFSGNCGQHPQFKHTAAPPPGYRFSYSGPRRKPRTTYWQHRGEWLLGEITRGVRLLGTVLRPLTGLFRSAPGITLLVRLRVLVALVRLFFTLLWNGSRLLAVLRFLQSRHFHSQLQLAKAQHLVFLTSMPYTYGQNPWVIEIEDPTTLFYPLIENGTTSGIDLADSPYFPIVKTLLESDTCKGIITHVRSTARMLPTLFKSETINRKIHYAPLGVPLPERWQRHEELEGSEEINLLFINSWCQIADNFYVRGGLDVLEAFAILHERYPQVRLTIRTALPPLHDHFHRIIESGWVRVINRFLPADEMETLLAESHLFLLPAARIHVVSLLQAMSYGLAVVTSDGWGIEEYVTHERNGLIVKGRYGKSSWADEQAGMLREDYEPMYTADPEFVDGLVEAVSRLIEDRELRVRLGCTARHDVQNTFSLEQWNWGLKRALDAALTGEPDATRGFAPEGWHSPGTFGTGGP
jgi:glycosyltransferase involved in cell wall biosynthesis